MSELIIWFENIQPRHQFDFGSKAANLGVIARNSLTAPGFCLSSKVYVHTLTGAGRLKKITALAEAAQDKDIDTIARASAEIEEIIKEVELPREVVAALEREYQKLINKRTGIRVAVRSSATAEDLPSASFAGQLESYLNIENFEQLKEAVIKCWCSLWSPRVIHYRRQMQVPQANTGMAVIIQEMVPAQVAGVMFTANPVNNSRDEMYLEAVGGLGEGLAQGKVSGERYIVSKNGFNISAQEMVGGTPLLNDFNIRWLADEGVKLEASFGLPQDIEWAYNWGDIYILQSRPITTLAEEEPEQLDTGKMTAIQRDIWTNVNERFPEPVLPLDSVIAKTYYMSLFEAYQKLGFSVPYVSWRRVEEGIFPDFFVPPAIKSGWRRIVGFWKMLNTDITGEWTANEQLLNRYLDLLKQDKLKDFPMEIIHEYLEDALKDFQRATTFRYLLYIQYSVLYNLLGSFLGRWYHAEGKEVFRDVVAGQPQMTMELNEQLAKLARQAQQQERTARLIMESPAETVEEVLAADEASANFLGKFHRFMEQYGSREISQGLGGIAAGTWNDDPAVVWGMLQGMLRAEQGGRRGTDISARRQAAEQRLEAMLSKGLIGILPIKGMIRKMVESARKYTAFREDSHFYLAETMPVFRALFLAIGRQFARRGLIEHEDDVMYLTYWELKELLEDVHNYKKISSREIREHISTTKQRYERRKKRWSSRNIGVDVQAEGLLKGAAASSGTVSGPCKVILDPRELSRLEPGDILVARYTNPSWTPVFSFIGGLIVEHGSAISHSAIIAREYGIPAVLGVEGVTEILKDKETVTIDGTNGLVQRERK